MTRWWARVLVSAAALLILLSVVPVERVRYAIQQANPWVWLAAAGIFAGGQVLNAVKLRLLCGEPPPALSACLRAHFAGISANLGLPGVAGGDVVRAAHLAVSAGAARITVAAIADRVVDFAVLLILLVPAAAAAGLPLSSGESRGEHRGWRAVAIGVLVAAGAWAGARRLRRWRGWPGLAGAAAGLFNRRGSLALALAIGLGVQLTFFATMLWLAAQVDVRMPVAPWLMAWAGAKLSAVLPVSAGGIGVREAALVTILAGYGAPPDAVLATGLLWEGALVAGSLGGLVATQLAASRST